MSLRPAPMSQRPSPPDGLSILISHSRHAPYALRTRHSTLSRPLVGSSCTIHDAYLTLRLYPSTSRIKLCKVQTFVPRGRPYSAYNGFVAFVVPDAHFLTFAAFISYALIPFPFPAIYHFPPQPTLQPSAIATHCAQATPIRHRTTRIPQAISLLIFLSSCFFLPFIHPYFTFCDARPDYAIPLIFAFVPAASPQLIDRLYVHTHRRLVLSRPRLRATYLYGDATCYLLRILFSLQVLPHMDRYYFVYRIIRLFPAFSSSSSRTLLISSYLIKHREWSRVASPPSSHVVNDRAHRRRRHAISFAFEWQC